MKLPAVVNSTAVIHLLYTDGKQVMIQNSVVSVVLQKQLMPSPEFPNRLSLVRIVVSEQVDHAKPLINR